MSLVHILITLPLAVIAGRLIPWRARGLFLMALSVLCLYWMQPALAIRNLDFWLPSLAIGLTIFAWTATQPIHDIPQSDASPTPGALNARSAWRGDLPAMILLAAIPVSISLSRTINALCCLTPTRPPQTWQVLVFLVAVVAFIYTFNKLVKNRVALSMGIILLVLSLLIVIKSPLIAQKVSSLLRLASGQPVERALATDLAWLGFSYLAFRLVHALRDAQAGKLPVYTLGEFVNYALFFPAFASGPIDRAQRWINEYRAGKALHFADYLAGARRIFWGLIKKFVLADSLALFALNPVNASQVHSTSWAWVLLYAYALRIYLDFSGYTDIAIGLGIFTGLRLPENFEKPYLKTNLTAFWNSWHITLAQWFRAYYFNPLTRFLRQRGGKLPVWGMILIGQVTTMFLIGLWHGITLNFVLWGLWHGLGLFIHNRWSEWMRPRSGWIEKHPFLRRLSPLGGWLLTFNFVVLSWVWFVLPQASLSLDFFRRLLGF